MDQTPPSRPSAAKYNARCTPSAINKEDAHKKKASTMKKAGALFSHVYMSLLLLLEATRLLGEDQLGFQTNTKKFEIQFPYVVAS